MRTSWVRAATIWSLILIPYAIGLATLVANASVLTGTVNAWGSALLVPAYGVPAGILVARLPRHPITSLFVVAAGFSTLDVVAAGSVARALATGSELWPSTAGMALFETVVWVPVEWALLALMLVFPDGRLPSERWRPAFALMTIGFVPVLLAIGSLPGPLAAWPMFANPLGVEGISPDARRGFAQGFTGIFTLVAVASALLRFRSARGTTRAQLKWFAFAAVAAGLTLPPAAALVFTPPPVSLIAILVTAVAIAFIPVAIAIAVLRYRLYEIDVLIRRTIVYAALSAVLLGGYALLVVVLQATLRPFTGGSELAVAGSTLAVVALAQPLRRRIQQAVDHRFYRSRYDAVRTLDAFTARMRDQVDIDAVRGEVLDVVGTTLRPAHASVWLREATR